MAYIKLEDLQKIPIRIDHYDKENGNMDFVLGIETVIEYAEKLPPADVVEVKHGEWIDDGFGRGDMICSACREYAVTDEDGNPLSALNNWQPEYCPNCSAKMDGERKENE